jgi:hypothetical protein
MNVFVHPNFRGGKTHRTVMLGRNYGTVSIATKRRREHWTHQVSVLEGFSLTHSGVDGIEWNSHPYLSLTHIPSHYSKSQSMMFLTDWTRRSSIIYAAMMMTLLFSLRLSESRESSLVRGHLGNEPIQTCDTQFVFKTHEGYSSKHPCLPYNTSQHPVVTFPDLSRKSWIYLSIVCRNYKAQYFKCDPGDCRGSELL